MQHTTQVQNFLSLKFKTNRLKNSVLPNSHNEGVAMKSGKPNHKAGIKEKLLGILFLKVILVINRNWLVPPIHSQTTPSKLQNIKTL